MQGSPAARGGAAVCAAADYQTSDSPWRGWHREDRPASGIDTEFVERVAVGGPPLGPVHPDVAAGAVDVEVVHAAGAGGGAVDRGPVGPVVGGLDLVGLPVGGLPPELHVLERGRLPQVDLNPLRIAPVTRPPRVPV